MRTGRMSPKVSWARAARARVFSRSTPKLPPRSRSISDSRSSITGSMWYPWGFSIWGRVRCGSRPKGFTQVSQRMSKVGEMGVSSSNSTRPVMVLKRAASSSRALSPEHRIRGVMTSWVKLENSRRTVGLSRRPSAWACHFFIMAAFFGECAASSCSLAKFRRISRSLGVMASIWALPFPGKLTPSL